jgi:hypothetical protein
LVGFDDFPIKSLDLDVRDGNFLSFQQIIFFAAPTLSTLRLNFRDYNFDAFPTFYVVENCYGLRHLQLSHFYFGDDVDDQVEGTLEALNDGMSRLSSLELICCEGNVSSFIELVDISKLEGFRYESYEDEDNEAGN